jgi:hypothetical protein
MSAFIRLGSKVQGNARSRVVAQRRLVFEQAVWPLVFVACAAGARLHLAPLEIGAQALCQTRLALLRLSLGFTPRWILFGLVAHGVKLASIDRSGNTFRNGVWKSPMSACALPKPMAEVRRIRKLR